MNQDEHQRERMRAWVAAFTATIPTDCGAHVTADGMLASFDKRFPAPAAVEVANVYDSSDGRVPVIDATELAALREKARLWDAVASGKVRLLAYTEATWWADYCGKPGEYAASTRNFHTAAEAVEAAIAAGALK